VLQPFAIVLAKNEHPKLPKRIATLHRGDVLYTSGEPKAQKSQSLYVSHLLPGLYVVLVAAYLAGMEGSFTISFRANYRSEFLPIWPPAWMVTGGRVDRDKERAGRGLKAKQRAQQASQVVRRGIISLFGGTGDAHDANMHVGGDSSSEDEDDH
jgi:hypothetical protein